ncbi:MAG: RNA polymerase sigma factor [Acidobacteriota bacterium]
MQQGSDPSSDARFEEIIESYGKFLRQAIERTCPRGLGIEFDDVEQEARVKLWKALKSERKIENVSSYLYRIAATVTIDAIRKVRARKEDQMIEPDADGPIETPVAVVKGDSPEDNTIRRELATKVNHALDKLLENRRLCVSLHLRGFTNIEIAKILGWTEPKTRNLIYRGLNDLREFLRDEGIDLELNTHEK